MAIIDIKVPDIGDFAEVGVIEVLVNPGEAIRAEQSLLTVESDKASMEIPSSHAGVVKELKVKLGDKIAEGAVVLTLEVQGDAAAAPAAAPAPAAPASEAKPAPGPLHKRQQLLILQQPASAVLRIWTATCSCWAVALAATRRLSGRLTWASRSLW